LFLLVVLLAAAQARTVTLREGEPSPLIRIECPVNETTRIVLPEPLRQLRGLGRATEPLRISVERAKPETVILVRPALHPSAGTVEFRGTSLAIRLLLESSSEGTGSEVRVTREPRAAPPSASPVPSSPPPSPAAPAAPVAAAPKPEVLDLPALLAATPVAIDRREGLPGHRSMRLVDALKGDKWVWLRFRLEGGAAARVESVSWEHGDVASFTQEPSGEDLRVVVQLPRAPITKKTRVTLKLAEGATYKFPLRPGTIPGLFRSLFE
jgi:hypothetical protein